MVVVFQSHADVLAQHLATNNHLINVNMIDFFMKYTLDAFGEVGFGTQLNAITSDIHTFANSLDYVQAKT